MSEHIPEHSVETPPITHAPDAPRTHYGRWIAGMTLAVIAVGGGVTAYEYQSDDSSVAETTQEQVQPSRGPVTVSPLSLASPVEISSSQELSAESSSELATASSAAPTVSSEASSSEVLSPIAEIAPSPITHLWLYERDAAGNINPTPYLDTAVAQNPEATIVKGQSADGRPIIDFVPGCLRSEAGECVEEDYDAVDSMTLLGDPTSLTDISDPRQKTGTWVGMHTSNNPDIHRIGSDLAKTTEGGLAVAQTANGFFVYDVVEAYKVLKNAVLSDPRINDPANIHQNELRIFTCVSSGGVIPEDQQENFFTRSVMVAAQTTFPDIAHL